MSELTPCNYCSLKTVKKHAQQLGRKVTMENVNGWIEVYVHPPEVKIITIQDRDKYRQISMMALTDHCVC